jgi:hypothetical protein
MKAIRFLQDLFYWLLLVFFGRNIQLAKSWNELNEKQLEEVATALESYRNNLDRFPSAAAQLSTRLYFQLIKNLLRTNNAVKVWVALRQVPPEEYSEHVQFLVLGINRTKFPAAFKIKRNTFYPPGARLANINLKEFSFADSLWYYWRQKKDDRYLDLLCATLYRTGIGANAEYDPRKAYIKNLVEEDVKLFSRIKKKKKLAIGYAYEGSRNYIVAQYPNIFPKPPEPPKGEQAEKSPRNKPVYTPFGKLVDFKIGFDPSKKREVLEMNIHDFFQTYENELIEMKNHKK